MICVEGNVLDTPFQFIAHQVNCKGVMGAGLAKQIRYKYPEVYEQYKEYCQTWDKPLGDCFGVWTNDKKHCILNLFGQDSYGVGQTQTDYYALRQSIESAIFYIRSKYLKAEKEYQIVIAIPYKIGCGLAGGDWEKVKDIFETVERTKNILFIAYCLE